MRYEFVLRGRLETIVEHTLDPLSVRVSGEDTSIILDATDDAELYGAISKMERLGLSILSFHPAHSTSSSRNGTEDNGE